MQKRILVWHNAQRKAEPKKIGCNDKSREYMNFTVQKGIYSKDFVKAYCAPFGYNLARFKNLSIEELFDKNNMKLISERPQAKNDKVEL